jgi:HK97 family phage major capsid protein
MIQFGAILQVADTITTETGEEIQWPYVDDTSNSGEYIGESEDAQDAGEPSPSFEQVKFRAWDFSSKFIKVPFNLNRDSLINVDVLLGRLIGERLGRKLSSEATTGEHKVRGIVPRSAAGQTAAGATAITYDDVVGLETSLDAGWEPDAAFMFHKNVLEHLRLLKDGNGRPLWVGNLAQGVPPVLNGKPYVINQSMASSIASTAKTMLYGDFRQYKIRRVGPSIRIVRLVERFAELAQTGYIGYLSADGNLLRPNTAAASPVQHLVQA